MLISLHILSGISWEWKKRLSLKIQEQSLSSVWEGDQLLSFQVIVSYTFFSLSLQIFHGRAVVNRSALCARPSRSKVLSLCSGKNLQYFILLLPHVYLLCCLFLREILSLLLGQPLEHEMCHVFHGYLQSCCNAKLICCQFSQVYHQWNVYLVNKTCSRLFYLKYSFQGCFFFNVPSCIYRLVAFIFIHLSPPCRFCFSPTDETILIQLWLKGFFFSLFFCQWKIQYQLL